MLRKAFGYNQYWSSRANSFWGSFQKRGMPFFPIIMGNFEVDIKCLSHLAQRAIKPRCWPFSIHRSNQSNFSRKEKNRIINHEIFTSSGLGFCVRAWIGRFATAQDKIQKKFLITNFPNLWWKRPDHLQWTVRKSKETYQRISKITFVANSDEKEIGRKVKVFDARLDWHPTFIWRGIYHQGKTSLCRIRNLAAPCPSGQQKQLLWGGLTSIRDTGGSLQRWSKMAIDQGFFL